MVTLLWSVSRSRVSAGEWSILLFPGLGFTPREWVAGDFSTVLPFLELRCSQKIWLITGIYECLWTSLTHVSWGYVGNISNLHTWSIVWSKYQRSKRKWRSWPSLRHNRDSVELLNTAGISKTLIWRGLLCQCLFHAWRRNPVCGRILYMSPA